MRAPPLLLLPALLLAALAAPACAARTRRSAAKPTPTPCCALAEPELRALAKAAACTSNKRLARLKPGKEKCEACARGACRLGYSCYCAAHFLGSREHQADCVWSFGAGWPVSAGKEDMDWRSCEKDAARVSESAVSCCDMTMAELTELRGLGGWCPNTYSAKWLVHCEKCPKGTCRLNNNCYCPEAFIRDERHHADCPDSFEKEWPASIGEEDFYWGTCDDMAKPVITRKGDAATTAAPTTTTATTTTTSTAAQTTTTTTTAAAVTTKTTTRSTTTTAKLTTTTTSSTTTTTSSKPTAAAAATNAANAASNSAGGGADTSTQKASGGAGLSVLEIVGIVVGIVTGLVGAVGGVYAVAARRRK